MDQDIRDFLRRFSWEELRSSSINPDMLQGYHLAALIDLMKKHQVTRLVAEDRGWFLTSDGEFANPGSREIRRGRVEALRSPGNVFWTQNPYINPHYKEFRLAQKFPIVEYSQSKPASSPRMDAQVQGHISLERPARRVPVSRGTRSSPIQWGPHLNATDGTTESLVNLCKRRAQEFLDLEDELREMQASMSDDAAVDEIRRDIRQRKIDFIADFTNHKLANPHMSSDVALRPIYDILERLNFWGEDVYNYILHACDTRDTAYLDSALSTVRNCQSETEYAFQEIPRIAEKQRPVTESHPRVKGGCMGILLGIVVGFVAVVILTGIWPDSGSPWPPIQLIALSYMLFIACPVAGWFLARARGKKTARGDN